MTHEEYSALISECQDIITEFGFTRRWAMIEENHQLGQRILREDCDEEFVIAGLSETLGKTRLQIERAIAFARKFPDLNKAPFAKNIAWHEIVHQYL
jgi:hypothetical protein